MSLALWQPASLKLANWNDTPGQFRSDDLRLIRR